MDNGVISTKHTHIWCHTWVSTHNTRVDDVMSTALHKKAEMSVERLHEAIQTHGKIPSHVVFSVFNTYVQWNDLPPATRLKALSLNSVTSTSPIDLDAWINIESFGKIRTDCSSRLCQQLIELLGRSFGESLALRDEKWFQGAWFCCSRSRAMQRQTGNSGLRR